MSLLFETIKVVNNVMHNIDYHNTRVNFSRGELFNSKDKWDLRNVLMPPLEPNQTYRCKIVYQKKIISIKFYPYAIKPIRTLKLVEHNMLDYKYKYFDRSDLEILKLTNNDADDIIITQQQYITDCTYANIIFYDGEKWITPATPLLKGTKRQQYIDNGQIFEQEIKIKDLKHFAKARIINSMIDIDESPDILKENIF